MQEIVERMIENMKQTCAVYEQILQTEREKQRGMIESRLALLTATIAHQESLVAQAGALEGERLELRRQLAQADRRLGPDARFHQLLEILEEPLRARLADGRARLIALTEQIYDFNCANRQLLKEIACACTHQA